MDGRTQSLGGTGNQHADRVPTEEDLIMPNKKSLRGVGAKEQRQYEHILDNGRKTGRYGKWAKEVAARTVLKQHKRKGHRKGA